MAKFEEVFEDTQTLFSTRISDTGLELNVNIKILSCNSLKQIGKVIKANELVKHMTNEDIIILLNEEIFEQLPADYQNIIVDDLLAEVYFDNEKGKISIIKPDFNAFSLVISKYSFETCLALRESIKSLFDAQKENEQ